MYCLQVISLFHHAQSLPSCNSFCLFILLFLSKQTKHGKNIVSFYFFLFISGRVTCLSARAMCGLAYVTVAVCATVAVC